MNPPPLPCADCGNTVGTNRYACKRCNRFAAAVRRDLAKQLAAAHPEEAARRTALITTHRYYAQKGSAT